jgi:tripeptidyl-peptidase-1
MILAYPDVALMGYDYTIIDGGAAVGVCGTSASTPVFAGMVTLVNNARLNAGKAPIGFLNPALYLLGNNPANGIFNDITSGENNCCAGYPGQQVCCQYGFTAAKGWDPTTGFGSINFAPFLSAMLKQ